LVVEKLKNYYLAGILGKTIYNRRKRAEMQKSSTIIDKTELDPKLVAKSESVVVQTVTSVPASAVMLAPTMTMEFGDRDMRLAAEGVILREKVKALDDLLMGKIEGDFWTYKTHDPFDSYEKEHITNAFESLKNELYEGESIVDTTIGIEKFEFEEEVYEGYNQRKVTVRLERPKVVSTIKIEILKIIMEKKTQGVVLTDFENRILNSAWLNLDGSEYLFTKRSDYIPLFENFLDGLVNDLKQFSVLGWPNLDQIIAYDKGTQDSVEGYSSWLTSFESDYGFDHRNPQEFYLWQARIEQFIESQTSINDLYKEEIIESVKRKFDNFRRVYRQGSDRLYNDYIVNLFKVAEILYHEEILTSPSFTDLESFIGLSLSSLPSVGEFTQIIKSLEDALSSRALSDGKIVLLLSYIIQSQTQLNQLNIYNQKMSDLIPSISPSMATINNHRRDLILELVSCHDALLGLDDLHKLDKLLFGKEQNVLHLINFLHADAKSKASSKFVARQITEFLNILGNIATWTTIDFDIPLTGNQLKELKKSATDIVKEYIQDHILIYGDLDTEGVTRNLGFQFMNDKFAIITAFWTTLKLIIGKNLGFSSLKAQLKQAGFNLRFPASLEKALTEEYDLMISAPQIKDLLNIIETLSKAELQRIYSSGTLPESSYNILFAIDTTLRSLAEYAGYYFLKETKSQVRNSPISTLLARVHQNLINRGRVKTRGLSVSSSGVINLRAQGLLTAVKHLKDLVIFGGFPLHINDLQIRHLTTRYSDLAGELKIGNSEKNKKKMEIFIKRRVGNEITETVNIQGSNIPKFMQELFDASKK
ncbi:hypothetical protein LCGC14_1421730, partial [marine sediment metagenome]